jgi:hypothetical protein
MQVDRRLRSTARKITAARDGIILAAARMQASCIDTSELTPPLVAIQEALAELALAEREVATEAAARQGRVKQGRKRRRAH